MQKIKHASEESTLAFKGKPSPEVKNGGINDLTKRTNTYRDFLKKRKQIMT